MKFHVNEEKENHVSDGVEREGSNNLFASQVGEVCLDHIQRMTFKFSGMSSDLTRGSLACLRYTREICLEDREWLLFFPVSNVSMCGLGQSGGRSLGKLAVAYRGLSFPVENLSRLLECQCASIALLSLRFRCLGELFARGFWLSVLLCREESVFSLTKRVQFLFR